MFRESYLERIKQHTFQKPKSFSRGLEALLGDFPSFIITDTHPIGWNRFYSNFITKFKETIPT